MTVQFIDTPSGERMVVLSLEEYERLVAAASEWEEMEADQAAYDAAIADLRKTKNPYLPAEVSALILAGNRLLKALRCWRGLTQVQLADKAGLTQGYLSDLEAGRRKGTRETMLSLAAALDVDPEWLTP